MKKSVLFVLVVLMLALISTAAGAQYKDTLTWAQGSDVTSLDPHQGKTSFSRRSLKAGISLTI